MTTTAARVRSAAFFVVLGAAALLWSQPSRSQQAPAGQQPAESPAYQDRYIRGGELPPDISTDDSASSDISGLARSLRIDGVANILSAHGAGLSDRTSESGLLLDAQWDSRSYGSWTADGALRTENQGTHTAGDSLGMFRLVERSMPFDGGWSADVGIGDTNAPDINLARFQSRFFLPTGPMQGVTTEWRGPSGVQLIAGTGDPGIYDGIAVPAFQPLGGSLATLGAQKSWGSQWTAGAQWVSAHNVELFTGDPFAYSGRASATTGLLSAAWQGSGARSQINIIDGKTSSGANSAGAWVDATLTEGRVSQSFGAVRLDPGLTWGNQLISNDVQGGYYQFGYQSRRWFTDVGIEQAWSVSGRGLDSTFATADARYQLSRDLGAGGAVNVRASSGSIGWSLQSYVDARNEWGIGRGQLNLVHSDSGREAAITVSEGWDILNYSHFSTSAGYEQITDRGAPDSAGSSSAASFAINGSVDLSGRLSVEGNLRWDRAVSGLRASALTADLGLSWQIAREWAFLASYFENRVGSWTQLTVGSPLSSATVTPIAAIGQRAVFLTVRYQRSAGQHFAPLGGAPGSGSGRLTGTVYLDANDNGQFDAGEAVAGNVTVVLDERYSGVTDSKGRFEFPAVVAGRHVITVIPDNLPLPWTVVGDGRVNIDIRTRDHTDISIAAKRHSVLAQQPE